MPNRLGQTMFRTKAAEMEGCGCFGRFLLAWYFIGIFAVISLTISGIVITCFFSFPAAIIMLLRNRNTISGAEVILLSILLIVGYGSVIFGINEYLSGDRFKSFIQFFYTLVMIYALRLELGRATSDDVAAFSGWLLFAILISATLEFFGPLQMISDTFRNWNGMVVYAADERDFFVAGFIRPKVFTQEPSYVAIGVAVFSFVWFQTTSARFRTALVLLSTAIVLYFERSPISLIVLPPIILILVSEIVRGMWGIRRIMYLYMAGVGACVALVVSLFALDSIIAARSQSGGQVGDQSLTVRLVAPPVIALKVLERAPVFGAGLGGRQAIASEVHSTFNDLGIMSSNINTSVEDAIPNAFWEHWIYLGLLGGAISAVVITLYFSRLCRGNWLLATLFLLLLANTFGAYTTPRIWSYATLVMIGASLERRVKSNSSGADLFKDSDCNRVFVT